LIKDFSLILATHAPRFHWVITHSIKLKYPGISNAYFHVGKADNL